MITGLLEGEDGVILVHEVYRGNLLLDGPPADQRCDIKSESKIGSRSNKQTHGLLSRYR